MKRKLVVRLLHLVVFTLLVAAFFDSTYRWNTFENYSENLVAGRVFSEINGVALHSTFGLGRLLVDGSPCNNDYPAFFQYPDRYQNTEKERIETAGFAEYTSQVGLQGYIFGFAARILQHPGAYLLLRLTNISMLILVLMLISGQITARYGRLMGICFLGVSAFSPWVRSFAPNLYWMEFTWFLPMLLGLLCLNKPKLRPLWYVLFFLSILFKNLCGFEYLTTIVWGAILFLAAEWVCCREKRKELFAVMTILALLSVAAFAIAYSLTAMMANPDLPFGEAAAQFYSTTAARRLRGTDPDSVGTTISHLAVLGLYFWEHLTGKAMLILTVLAATALIVRKRLYGESKPLQLALCLLSLFGTLSWIVLAKEHSYMHLHLNFVLWFIGTAQIETYIILDGLWSHRHDLIGEDGA